MGAYAAVAFYPSSRLTCRPEESAGCAGSWPRKGAATLGCIHVRPTLRQAW
jgi:hypothetical protein